jgi:ADP-ribose pyrophosphatase YjhB (NUDIX family)
MTGDSENHPRRKYPDAPLVGVGAVAVKDGKILVVKRAFEPGAGKWSVPGGLVEIGEKLSDACAREMKEETGIDVQVLELINVFDMIDRDESGRVRYHYVLADFLTKPVGGTETPNAEVSEMRWVTPQQAKALNLTNTARKALEELFGGV